MTDFRSLLCDLGDFLRDRIVAGRAVRTAEALQAVAHVATADTIYGIDTIGEAAVCEWFSSRWPADEPVHVVMEGIEDSLCFPEGIPVSATRWKCLLDPIDGTRGLMYDKRSAWVLAGLAPQRGADNRLSDIFAAAMTEIPTTRQWRADQLSATRGGGVTALSRNVLDGTTVPLVLRPSSATDFAHGFAWMAKYFPPGRTLTAQIEERLWETISAEGETVFDDQYISTGGAFYELMAGHDRFVGDIRPLVFARLGLDSELVCHPYDVSAALVLTESGVFYEHPLGGFPDAPMDTTTPVAWVGYANPSLAALARPVLQKILKDFLNP